jgi:AcrR family transcriptional regulator
MSTLKFMGSEKRSRVLDAAKSVFWRYGYRRVTMGDIASAAGISRPALYLLFCNKERIFEAVLRDFVASVLEEIRLGITLPGTPMEKLRTAFELWAVRPFMLLADAPDARDLIQCGYDFAKEAMEQSYAAFEVQLVAILETIPEARSSQGPSLEQIAHILSVSVHGFKGAARDASELRDMINAQLHLTVTALEMAAADPAARLQPARR